MWKSISWVNVGIEIVSYLWAILAILIILCGIITVVVTPIVAILS